MLTWLWVPADLMPGQVPSIGRCSVYCLGSHIFWHWNQGTWVPMGPSTMLGRTLLNAPQNHVCEEGRLMVAPARGTDKTCHSCHVVMLGFCSHQPTRTAHPRLLLTTVLPDPEATSMSVSDSASLQLVSFLPTAFSALGFQVTSLTMDFTGIAYDCPFKMCRRILLSFPDTWQQAGQVVEAQQMHLLMDRMKIT
ncbi:uncharacterized protein LOC106510020 isoform X2 [Sus scrofa]|uniref:uncharacterized protein LOC106510020 isoform X2 n=2 Tax=Sus scrofa TaxID=9823 RepID=UPI0006B1EF2C|nr:uncharacterized protein LOC106510020 isoform X2 [Sus scrofa]